MSPDVYCGSSSLLSTIHPPSAFIAFIVNLNRHRDALFMHERENKVLPEPNGATSTDVRFSRSSALAWLTRNFAMEALKRLHLPHRVQMKFGR